jgi:23S rRNA pseudouridine2604 synthase
MTERLNKRMATLGLATRRGADELIRQGLVFVNGKEAVLGQQISEADQIEIRDESGAYREQYEYVAYYKPKGVVTHSPTGKQKDIRKVSGFPELFPVGRLDKDSEGLMMLTNDGRVTDRLLHPRFAHEKEYFVEFSGRFPKNGEKLLLAGISHKGELLIAKEVTLIDRKHITLVLTEGKRHEVRRMLATLGLEVIRLQRNRIINIRLGSLTPGNHRRLTGKALKAFKEDIGL